MGLLGVVMKRKWAPMVGAGAIRFRRELKLFQPYVLETRVSTWSDSRLVMEQRVLIGNDETVAARGLILAGFYDRKMRGFVACERIFEATGTTEVVVPALDAAAAALLQMDQALKE
jgi:acyl-CoA thioesterase FadM